MSDSIENAKTKVKRWVCEHYAGKQLLQRDGANMVVESPTKGDARAEFKKVHGERAVKKRAGRSTRTSRIRLPGGYRVKNADKCLAA